MIGYTDHRVLCIIGYAYPWISWDIIYKWYDILDIIFNGDGAMGYYIWWDILDCALIWFIKRLNNKTKDIASQCLKTNIWNF